MEKADLNKQRLLVLIVLICYIQKGTGFTSSPTASINCASSVANINFNLTLDPGESIVGKRIWFFGATKVAESNGTTLTIFGSYLSRVTAYGTYGISLSNVTVADAGSYTYTITVSPSGNPFIAAATLTVQVAPLAPPSGCLVSASQSGNTVTCTVSTGNENCGTPSLNPYWVNSTPPSNQFQCTVRETHQCCATSDALTCYSGNSNDFCILYPCTPTTPPPDTTFTMTTASTTILTTNTQIGTTANITSTSSGTTANITRTSSGTTENLTTTSCTPPDIVIIGVSVSGFLFFLVIIIIIICCCRVYCYRKERYISEQYENGTELKSNYNETDTNYTAEEDATLNPAYGLSNILSVSSTSDEFPTKMPDLEKKKDSESESNKLTQDAPFQSNMHASKEKNHTSTFNQDLKDKLISDKNELEESKMGKEEITNL